MKTCVGAEHCRFGTQRFDEPGVKLEKMLFGTYSPHKVKLAVSGCSRNRAAEAGNQGRRGIIGVDSGYFLRSTSPATAASRPMSPVLAGRPTEARK